MLGNVFYGVGFIFMFILGIIYIDNNMKVKNIFFYLGR